MDYTALRETLKSRFGIGYVEQSDQEKGIPQPPLEKPLEDGAEVYELPDPGEAKLQPVDLRGLLQARRSVRQYSEKPVSREELSFMLWATQGVHSILGDSYATLRSVPSAGARHPYETYLNVTRVDGMEPGLYRYLPLSHRLAYLKHDPELPARFRQASLNQEMVETCAVLFIWTCVPYRTEWRYGQKAHKVLLIDAGHICENLYLAAGATGCGACAVAAYTQGDMDRTAGVDGRDEFAVYLCTVGKLKE